MPLYRDNQKIKDLYFDGRKIKEAWTMVNGVMTKVFSALKMPTIGAAATTIPGTASFAVTATVPAGNVGDLILMVVAHEGTLLSFPEGWTRDVRQSGDNWGRIAVFTKVRTESEPSVPLAFSQSKRHVVRIMSITGGKTISVTDQSSGGTSAITGGPGITTTTPKCLIVSAVGWKSTASPTISWESPFSLLFKDSGAAVSSSVTTLAIATAAQDSPVRMGDYTVTSSLAAIGGKGIATIAISPV